MTAIGGVGGASATLYLLGGHILRITQRLIVGAVEVKFRELESRVEDAERTLRSHHDDIHANPYGIRAQLSDARQRVAIIEGVLRGKGGG